MTQQLKQRLVGAIVLIALAVIFMPILLDGSIRRATLTEADQIPERPLFIFEPINLPPKSGVSIPEAPVTTTIAAEPQRQQPSDSKVNKTVADAAVESKPSLSLPPKPLPTTVSAEIIPAAWAVQVASFSSYERARALHDQLEHSGLSSFIESSKGAKSYYRVKVGPEIERAAAERIRDQVADALKLDGQVVQYRPGVN